MAGIRWLAAILVPLAVLAVACGDDDGADGSPTGATTETPAAPTDTPAPTETLVPTETASPTPANALTEEMIAATSTYLATSAEVAYEVTDPARCEAITELIDAGEAEIPDFVGENLVCLVGAVFGDGEVRVGFGPYASEVIGVLVLEETDDGGWRGVTIEPGPQAE